MVEVHEEQISIVPIQAGGLCLPNCILNKFQNQCMLVLGAAVHTLVMEGVVSQTHGTTGFVTPAVMRVLKHVLIVMAGDRVQPSSKALTPSLEVNMLLLLIDCLVQTAIMNARAVQQSSADVFLQACAGSHSHLHPKHRPSSLAPDVQLLGALCKRIPGRAVLQELRCKLIETTMGSWANPSSRSSPFPALCVEDQIRGSYVAAHHCVVQTVAWFKRYHAQHKSFLSGSLPDQKRSSTSLQLLVPKICTSVHASMASDAWWVLWVWCTSMTAWSMLIGKPYLFETDTHTVQSMSHCQST